ncbi:MAG TPA: hypothetical protein VK188_10120 [Holophaga sp.]|nr:hypothetical protein [Holophaga sp.]
MATKSLWFLALSVFQALTPAFMEASPLPPAPVEAGTKPVAGRTLDKGSFSVVIPIWDSGKEGLSTFLQTVALYGETNNVNLSFQVVTPSGIDTLMEMAGEVEDSSDITDLKGTWPKKVLFFEPKAVDSNRTLKMKIKDGDKLELRFFLTYTAKATHKTVIAHATTCPLTTQDLDAMFKGDRQTSVLIEATTQKSEKINFIGESKAEDKAGAATSHQAAKSKASFLASERYQGGQAFYDAWSKGKDKKQSVVVNFQVWRPATKSAPAQSTILTKSRATDVKDLGSIAAIKGLAVTWEGDLQLEELEKLQFPSDGSLYLLLGIGLVPESSTSSDKPAASAKLAGMSKFKDAKAFEGFREALRLGGVNLGLTASARPYDSGTPNGVEVNDASWKKIF